MLGLNGCECDLAAEGTYGSLYPAVDSTGLAPSEDLDLEGK